jgi:hypothetical protein
MNANSFPTSASTVDARTRSDISDASVPLVIRSIQPEETALTSMSVTILITAFTGHVLINQEDISVNVHRSTNSTPSEQDALISVEVPATSSLRTVVASAAVRSVEMCLVPPVAVPSAEDGRIHRDNARRALVMNLWLILNCVRVDLVSGRMSSRSYLKTLMSVPTYRAYAMVESARTRLEVTSARVLLGISWTKRGRPALTLTNARRRTYVGLERASILRATTRASVLMGTCSSRTISAWTCDLAVAT